MKRTLLYKIILESLKFEDNLNIDSIDLALIQKNINHIKNIKTIFFKCLTEQSYSKQEINMYWNYAITYSKICIYTKQNIKLVDNNIFLQNAQTYLKFANTTYNQIIQFKHNLNQYTKLFQKVINKPYVLDRYFEKAKKLNKICVLNEKNQIIYITKDELFKKYNSYYSILQKQLKQNQQKNKKQHNKTIEHAQISRFINVPGQLVKICLDDIIKEQDPSVKRTIKGLDINCTLNEYNLVELIKQNKLSNFKYLKELKAIIGNKTPNIPIFILFCPKDKNVLQTDEFSDLINKHQNILNITPLPILITNILLPNGGFCCSATSKGYEFNTNNNTNIEENIKKLTLDQMHAKIAHGCCIFIDADLYQPNSTIEVQSVLIHELNHYFHFLGAWYKLFSVHHQFKPQYMTEMLKDLSLSSANMSYLQGYLFTNAEENSWLSTVGIKVYQYFRNIQQFKEIISNKQLFKEFFSFLRNNQSNICSYFFTAYYIVHYTDHKQQLFKLVQQHIKQRNPNDQMKRSDLYYKTQNLLKKYNHMPSKNIA